jgi:ribosome-binding protein aMBF1 (putative translation factor)
VIGQRLLRARKAAGLSLRDLAERTCVSHTAISKFEKGLLTPFSFSEVVCTKCQKSPALPCWLVGSYGN